VLALAARQVSNAFGTGLQSGRADSGRCRPAGRR